jgi:translation initiation factor IF-2
MAEDKMMRLSQVARILNVGISTIVDHLSAKGYKVESNPNTKINSDQISYLAKDFKSDDLKATMSHRPTPVEGPVETKIEKVERDVDEVSSLRKEPTEPVAEKPKTEEKAPSESKESDNKLPGIKVVGKIDLNAKKPVVVQPTAPVQESEKVQEVVKPVATVEVTETPVKKTEEAPVVTPQIKEEIAVKPTPEPVAEPVKVATPVVPTPEPVKETNVESVAPKIQVKEEPVQPPVAQKSEEVKKSTPIKVEETVTPAGVQPVVENTTKKETVVETPSTAPEDAAPDLIEARGEQLRGLRVIGKIELPSDKFKKKDPVASSDAAAADKKRRRKRKRIRDGAPGAPEVKPNVGGTTPAVGANPQPRAPREPHPGGNRNANKPAHPGPPANTNTTATPSTNSGNSGGGNAKSGSGNNSSRGNNRRGNKREEVSDKEVASNIKATMARMGGSNNTKLGRGKGLRRRDRMDQNDPNATEDEETKVLRVTEFVSANDLASLMDVTVQEVISVCMSMGMFVSINQRLDAEAITFIADEFGFEVAFISAEEEVHNDVIEEVDNEEDLVERAPIVTIMGHVDHGKTSLLDYIRQENVASGEAGGITQHIGAYSVKTKTGKQVTFLDTPGHEAFTAMRARGAKVTDVVIIVIAADDSVMPQTREAINHAQVAGVPIVFAFSKVDKPGANTEKIREELANMNLLVEEWGGKYQTQEISSKSGLGIDDLLEKVLLESEILDLKANPNRRASGSVVEASLDKGRGYITTILVQTGTLKVGDVVLAGAHFGKVKAMTDYLGRKLKSAGPSMPVQLLGLNGAPQAGDSFNVFENERDARDIATKREQIQREQSIRTRKHITLEEIGRRKAIGSFRELNLIVKGDVDGSVEALSDSLLQLSTNEVQVNIIHKAVGQISESDVNLAIASDAIVLGFQVRPSANAKKMAEQDQIEIRHYSVIYSAIDEIKDAMTGMLAPTIEEIVTGNIEIREVFKISRIGTIAGCYVTDGFVKRNNKIRVIRDGIVLLTGDIDSLKRFKDDVQEVKTGYECGLSIKNFNDIEVGDIIESFELREVKRSL